MLDLPTFRQTINLALLFLFVAVSSGIVACAWIWVIEKIIGAFKFTEEFITFVIHRRKGKP